MTVAEGRALGAWLGVVSRSVVRSVGLTGGEGGEGKGMGDWNIVQNNGGVDSLKFGGGLGGGAIVGVMGLMGV